jgi:hypothetical protein
MSNLLRGSLIAIAVVVAFAGGFFVKSYIDLARSVAAEPKVAGEAPRTMPASAKTVAGPWPVASARTKSARSPTQGPTTGGPAPQLTVPKAPEPPDPFDPAFQMIKNELGIKTTVVDKSEPEPAVLRDAKRDQDRIPPEMPAIPVSLPRSTERQVPPNSALKLVNNRSVELDFEVTKSGRSRIRATELWGTRNGGASWQKMDQMMGCESPFRTRLGSEGQYGFKLVFESESGQRTPDPRAGESPDTTLALDTSPPHIVILPPVEVPDQPRMVRFRWSMSDSGLDARSARLDYSVDGKTWERITDGKEYQPSYSYHHDWKPPPGAPTRVLLRVTARDEAGNVGTAQTNEMVAIDLVVPAGRITRVRGEGAELGPMPRIVPIADVVSPFPPVPYWGSFSTPGLLYKF